MDLDLSMLHTVLHIVSKSIYLHTGLLDIPINKKFARCARTKHENTSNRGILKSIIIV